eukprot:1134494-Karenia_brevis.AAC.1
MPSAPRWGAAPAGSPCSPPSCPTSSSDGFQPSVENEFAKSFSPYLSLRGPLPSPRDGFLVWSVKFLRT